jgi:hypothetical protein
MKFEIKRSENGIILTADNGDSYCYQESYGGDEDHDAFADFLRVILDNFGPADDGRHEKKRIYISVRHGDNYVCPDKPCQYCLPRR